MAIIVNLDIMMARRKISLGELAEKIDITPANLSILKTGKAKAIRFSTLEAICKVLDCQPADILEYQEEEKKMNGRYLVRRISTVHSILPFYLYFPSFALNASAYIRICFTIDSNPLLRVGDK